ncbi:MAG: Gfo/Idh/MocA family oxidoreductase [Anaerolineae bacterium]|nr:Gfo/Idh/MocA family oxidoreductase [Anaerolineae bacterium]
MRKLRIGIVGMGIGLTHLKGYKALPDAVDVVALCDLNEALMTSIGAEYGVPLHYKNFQDMFTSGEVDAVSICLPNSLHAPASIAALEAGLHVLCEKPVAENATAAQKIVDVEARSPGKFMVCYNRRYRPDVKWMKNAINNGLLGHIYQVKAGWVREAGIPTKTGWFINKKVAGGGPLIDLGVHMLDLALWLLGYPKPLTVSGTVQANFGPHGLKIKREPTDPPLPPYDVEDTVSAFVRLEGGTTLNLETNWASHTKPGKDDLYITLVGTKGTIEFYVENYAAVDTLTFYTEVEGAPVTIRPGIVGERSDHLYAVAEFVKCIQEDSSSPATVHDGLTVMKIIDAIYESAARGNEIAVDAVNK